MRVNFVVNPVFDGWEPTDERLGGTELQVVKWAEGLVSRGHAVNVYRNGSQMNEHNGVHYWKRDLHSIPEHREDVALTINVKSSDIAPYGPTIYFTNETNAANLNLSKYDAVVWPSQWCVDNIPVNNPSVHVIPHGYDPNAIYPGEKVPKQCLYASSPDRGLDTLLEAWPQVLETNPDATLIVTYGAQAPEDVPKNVYFLGSLSEDEMQELYRTSDVWCHPANGGELFCITGLNAQAAGCVPVVIPTMALSETVKHGFFATKEDYAEILSNILGDEALKSEMRTKLAAQQYPTWNDTVTALEQLIQKVV